MVIFEQVDRNAEALRRIGERVQAESRVTQTPFFYADPAYGIDVIREFPDGRRERLKPDGTIEPVPPRGG